MSDNHDGPAKTSPYPMSRLAGRHELVNVAEEIQRADKMLATATSARLKIIVNQIRALQERAAELLNETKRDAKLHRASCAFQKRVGHIYHLYEEASGATRWSMLSPQDWGSSLPHTYLGSYRLEGDMSYTSLDEIAKRNEDDALVGAILPPEILDSIG